MITIGVQVNGKTVATIDLSPNATEEQAVESSLMNWNVTRVIRGRCITKTVYQRNRILNIITDSD